jgi:hypothetical protein
MGKLERGGKEAPKAPGTASFKLPHDFLFIRSIHIIIRPVF